MIKNQELTVVVSIAVNSSIHGTYQEYQLFLGTRATGEYQSPSDTFDLQLCPNLGDVYAEAELEYEHRLGRLLSLLYQPCFEFIRYVAWIMVVTAGIFFQCLCLLS
ncbi:hypothetical protein H6G97_26165 [Nostoc flagelliforme FACHB-838]|uniref:Seipin n=1 Tax=Nostoc flagelliforme FACHB-838 TaxID=2692904 RepID=A0ABR8DUL8_9NOSO|nr:hypothetical protein [Nostoc flagelliforme]MBD2532879.1 hypothetical protein [Nostoc flagelliforme FACHB-838]